jgi:hypothetical protein
MSEPLDFWLPTNRTRRVTTGPVTMTKGRSGTWAQFVVYWDFGGVRSGMSRATMMVGP